MNFKKIKEIPVSNMAISKKTILTLDYKLMLNAFQLFGIKRCVEFHTIEGHSSLGLNQC
jgi:hypothetical protein